MRTQLALGPANRRISKKEKEKTHNLGGVGIQGEALEVGGGMLNNQQKRNKAKSII